MKWLARFSLLLLVLCAFLLGAAAWLVGTEGGLRWALARAQAAAGGKLIVEGASGVLAGTVRIQRLAFQGSGIQLESHALHTRAGLLAALAGRVALDPLEAESLTLVLRPGGEPAASPPALPYGIDIENVVVQNLEIAREGERHSLRDVRLSHLRLDRALSAEGSFTRPDERLPLQASFTLKGSLERMAVATALTVAGIPAKGKALVRPLEKQKLEALEASAGPVDLSRFDAALPRTAISANLEVKAAAGGGLAGALSAANAAHGPLDEDKVPVARIETRFATADLASATLEHLRLALSGGGMLEGKGAVSLEAVQAELRATGIDLRALRSSLRATRLDGPLQLHLTAKDQRVSGRLSQEGMSVAADLRRHGDVLEVRNLRAAAAGGELRGEGRLRLAGLTFDAKLELAAFNPAAFGAYPEGSLNASIIAAGSREAADLDWTMRDSTLLGRPLQSRGSARVAEKRVSRAQAQATYGTARASVRGDFGQPRDRMEWQLQAPQLGDFAAGFGGSLVASGSLSGSWSDPQAAGSARVERLQAPAGVRASEVRARFSGRLGRHEIDLSAKAPEVEVEARLRGGWHRPQGWSGELVSLANTGTYPVRLEKPAQLKLARDNVELGGLQARLGAGRLVVAGLRWQPQRLSSSGEFSGLPAQWLVALTGLARRIGGSLMLDGAWSLAASPRLEGTVRVRRASGDVSVDKVALGLQEASIDGRFTDGRLALDGRLASRFGSAALEGTIDRAPDSATLGAASPIALRARADLAAIRALARPFIRGARLDGRVRAELAAGGTLAEPTLGGELLGDAITFEMREYGVFLRDGTLRAKLEGEELRVAELSVQAGDGRFTASGTLPLRMAARAARLEWQARNFTLVERSDTRLVASGKGEVLFDGKRFSLTGDLRADRGRFELARERLPQLGEDVVIVGKPPAARKDAVRLPVAVDLMLDLGDELQVRAQGFEGRLVGRVQLQTGKEGELRAYGEVRAVNSTFLAYGQTLQVDPGVLIFDGPLDNPSLQVTAWRRNQAVEAGVQISGTARAPRVQLVSQPPVPEGERLSWLVLGRAPGEASQADLGLLQAAAGALLASGDAMPLDRRLARSVGLDEVSLRGTGEVQDRVVAFGKRLSDRVYVSYERGIGAMASNLVKLDYALSQRWSVRAETGSTAAGSATSGWGLFYRFSWD
jgi:translocation and assembly module TamB